MTASDSASATQRAHFLEDLRRWGPDASQAAKNEGIDFAKHYCKALAKSHYENFSVASFLIPKALRQDFYHIYAYCRWSDDLADEVGNREESLRLLDWWSHQFDASLAREVAHPVLRALSETIHRHRLPTEPFRDLLAAFRQDQEKTRYRDDVELLNYCKGSANPVGRILLAMAQVDDRDCLQWSDSICTGLQIANFCQDLALDAKLGRIYLPESRWHRQQLTEEMLLDPCVSDRKREALREWVEYARCHFALGAPLSEFVPNWLRRDVRLFVEGGKAILNRIEASGFDVWSSRVKVSKGTKLRLLLSQCSLTPSPEGNCSRNEEERISRWQSRKVASELRWSQIFCERIARSSGSNFYTSFSLLRPEKRKAMSTLYAFARIVDDVVDGPVTGGPIGPLDRDLQIQEMRAWHVWLDNLVGKQPCDATGDHLPDAMRRKLLRPAMDWLIESFSVPVEHLHAMVDGSLQDASNSLRFETDDDVRDYFYRVASTVGLVCLFIWRGELQSIHEPAIECGMAFQRTNILRDVREDAMRNRIYIPLEEFRSFGVDPQTWIAGQPTGDWRSMLRKQVSKARDSFHEGWSVYDGLESDGKRMFSLIWETYFRLLDRIEENLDNVWQERTSLRRSDKLWLAGSHFLSPWFLHARGRTRRR